MDPSLRLWRRACAEALAAFALVFAGCGAIIANQRYHGAPGAYQLVRGDYRPRADQPEPEEPRDGPRSVRLPA